MTTVVILQPQYLPWRGVFEQIRLADVYIHFDDVQMPMGRSFTNRVQIKTAQGPVWMTIPIRRTTAATTIAEVRIDDEQGWRRKHLALLRHAFARTPHADAALGLAEEVLAPGNDGLCALNCRALERIAGHLGLRTRFVRSSTFAMPGKATDKLKALVAAVGGRRYLTGHGARNYLDHEAFERDGIEVHYIDYQPHTYPQLHGPFTPYVSILDAVANLGPQATSALTAPSVDWRQFLERTATPNQPAFGADDS